MPPRGPDIAGTRVGRWSVLSVSDVRVGKSIMYNCRCDCGTEKLVYKVYLVSGTSQSCGCLQVDKVTTHGKVRTPIYYVWRNIKVRCLVATNHDYPNYGGRGIVMCQEWLDSFAAFYAHVGEPPTSKHKIERIDNDKGYEPGNVRWATQKEQMENRRCTKKYTHNGVTKPITVWAAEHGVPSYSLGYYLLVKKIPFEEAVVAATRRRRRKDKWSETPSL